LASRVMRRDYGSLVPDLIDEPQNDATRLQCMSAAVIALSRWETRIALNTIDIRWSKDGRAVAELSGIITRSMQPATVTMTLRESCHADS
uniref:GPW/gp25 family protein n=2 Tax=Enterobacterales TaxID=91347 RepID=UPI0024E123EA